MTTEQTPKRLRKGDLFLVDFGDRRAGDVKNTYYKYRGFWMEIVSTTHDGYYFQAVCKEKHNRAMAGKRTFDWDTGVSLNWRKNSDFTQTRRLQRMPEAPMAERPTLPNI